MYARMRRVAVVLALAMASAACGDDYTRVEEAPGETPAMVPEREQTEIDPVDEGEQEPVGPVMGGEESDAPLGSVPAGAGVPGAPVTEPLDPDLDTDRDGVLDPGEGLGDADGDGVRDRDEP